MEKQVIYSTLRDIHLTRDIYADVKNEMISIFQGIKPNLDAILDEKETYSFNSQGIKILDSSCKPIRVLEYLVPILVNSVYVGFAMLRVTNKRPDFGPTMLLDCLERTYELRFKLYSGAVASVEGCNISLVQKDRGGYHISTGSLTPFHKVVLAQQWEEFKGNIAFELDKPTRREDWGINNIIYARS